MSKRFFEKEMHIGLAKDQPPVLLVHKKNSARSEEYLPHLNNYIEMYVYISGNADYIVEEHYIPLVRGDVVVILPHEVHVPVLKSECEYERFYMLIPPRLFSHFAFDPLISCGAVKGHKIALPPKEREEFLSLLYRISALSEKEELQSARLRAAGMFLEVQGILSGASQNDDAEIPSGFPKNLREIMKYIGLHAQEIPSVEAIAKHFYISPQYLSTFFKKHVGVNVNHYLRIKKIAVAKTLLEGGSTVAEACYECGFSDSSHFIKCFKRYVGMTPKQYKDSYRD